MNYILLNDEKYFKDKVKLKNFKEVSKYGRERCDGIFGTITTELLEECSKDNGRRNKFFEEGGLDGSRGCEFVVFKIPQNLLYFTDTKLIEECTRFIDENDFYTQIWSFSYQNSWKYFLIGIKKTHDINYIFDTNIDAHDEAYGIQRICQKIEEVLF